MTTLWMKSLLFGVSCLIQGTHCRIIGTVKSDYPIIERPSQQHRSDQQLTMKLTLSQLKQLKLLSYSDDSTPKQMESFYLGLYETDGGELPASSIGTVMDGVNDFVHTELNAIYDSKNNVVRSIQTTIVSQATAASSRRHHRSMQVTTGSNLETQLHIFFANEPSPDTSDVTSKVHGIFEDTDKLQYLLTNITSRRTADDTALSNVNAIFFLKDVRAASMAPVVVGTQPTSAPNVGDGGGGSSGTTDGGIAVDIEDPKEQAVDRESSSSTVSSKILIPILISASVVLVLLALFTSHRRRQAHSNRHPVMALAATNQLSTAELTGNDGDVNLFWESDDIFSIEAALVETSNNTSKSYITQNVSVTATPTATTDFLDDDQPNHPTIKAASTARNANNKIATDDQSDIFSGVMSGFLDNFSNLSSPRYMSSTGIDSLESPLAGVGSSPMNGGAGDSRSVFSFLSGFASKASTVVASNVTPSTQSKQQPSILAISRNITSSSPVVTDSGISVGINPTSPSNEGGRMGGTPHSRVSSLFTFSEEDSEDLVSSSDDRSKEANKGKGLLLGAPSDEDEEDNESLTALANTAVNIESASDNSGKEESTPTFINGTSIVVAAAEPELPHKTRSQMDVSRITEKYANKLEHPIDSPYVSPAPSMSNVAHPAEMLSKGTSTESKQNDCCKDAYANVFNPTQEPQQRHASSSVVNEILTDLTLAPNDTAFSNQDGFTRLSADEITKELAAAEKESNQLKKLSTHWTMSMFASPTAVESPAAATYNGRRAADLASPSSIVSNKSEPSNVSGNQKIIQLQWDDPNQSSLNRMKAAAFAESVTGHTFAGSTGKDSASERFTMFTGRKSNVHRVAATRSADANSVKERMSTKSAGHVDGTNIYQIDAAEEDSVGSNNSSKLSISPRRGTVAKIASGLESAVSTERIRVHAKNMAADGTTNYQHEAMGEWSVAGDNDDHSLSDSDSAGKRKSVAKTTTQTVLGAAKGATLEQTANQDTPRSTATNTSAISALSPDTPKINSDASPSKQLISDLLWLEHKIAATNQAILTSPKNQGDTNARGIEQKDDNPLIDRNDSLSFASNDGVAVNSPDEPNSSNDTSLMNRANTTSKDDSMSVHQSIVCRDCFAPPGKLKIIIHSTKDGPAVHTVKKGSSLEGHIFAGDLIISVDNVDTRSYSAEQVMKMMTAKTRFERKITVLHFEKETI